MDRSLRLAYNALGWAETRYAPDGRVAVFALSPIRRADGLTITGAVTEPAYRTRAMTAVRDAVSEPVTDDITVLATASSELVVAEPRVACHAEPDADSERVTELLYGQQVDAYDANGEWRRVRCPDGYVAWAPTTALQEPAAVTTDALISAPSVEGPTSIDHVYAGTPCQGRAGSDPGETQVRFVTGDSTTVPSDAVTQPPTDPSGELVVSVAESLLGTDYRWGGMTVDGIDCSGLVWLSYRLNGLSLPRDADQQRAMGLPVDRDSLQAGDLVLFPGHVAISTGGTGVVHAEGQAGGVVRASLDPGDDPTGPHDVGYAERLDEEFASARRLC